MQEAPKHPHMAARETFVTRHGVTQPAPAPRFSRTPSAIRDAQKVAIADVANEWKSAR
jgi:alpha-methylacyl-CoA racemase